MNMVQPSQRLNALIFGLAITFVLFVLAVYLTGWRCCRKAA
jgi:hypothetical protein